MFSKFGRQIFSLYEKRPLLMNSLVGGSVYVAGEYTVQTQSKDVRFFDVDNWKKLAQVGTLGSVENGVIMLKWYGILNKYVGSGVTTNVVLLKCFLDQIFFATQQDFMFLGLCAWTESEAFSEALQEVKDTFLTTWIVDCSLWPVVNFVGFAFVPYILQPTYMAFVSYFWQLYLSATAASKSGADLTDQELESLFRALDTDNSNFIDADELQAFFRSRNIQVSDAEIRQMIADADHIGREFCYEELGEIGVMEKEEVPEDDGVVSLEEFKRLATHGSVMNLKSSALWSSVRQDIALTKGAKHAMKRLEEVQKQREVGVARKLAEDAAAAAANAQFASAVAVAIAHSPESLARDRTAAAPVGLISYLLGEVEEAPVCDNASTATANAATVSLGTADRQAVQKQAQAQAQSQTQKEVLRAQEERDKRELALAENRAAAIEKATVGGAVLTGAVLFRKLVFKV